MTADGDDFLVVLRNPNIGTLLCLNELANVLNLLVVHHGRTTTHVLLQERLTRDLALVHARRGRLLLARDVDFLGGSSILRLRRRVISHILLLLRHFDTLAAHV